MADETTSQILLFASATGKAQPENVALRFEHAATRDFVGLNAPTGALSEALMASPVQLEALMTGLKAGEQLVAHLDFSTAKSAGLSIEIIGCGSSRSDAVARGTMLGGLLDAALAAGLPAVEVLPRLKRRTPPKLAHACVLAPAGFALPIGAAQAQSPCGGEERAAFDWSAGPREAIIFSPAAIGAHLAGLGAALSAVKTPLYLEVRMSRIVFDAALMKQIAVVRRRIAERFRSDPTKFVRDQRFSDADKRLEDLIVAGNGIKLAVTVRSRRPLDPCEVSALSATLFGMPHDEHQCGYLAELRSHYPRDEAVHSFFGIIAAAIGPTIERSQVAKLEALDGNIIGRLKSGATIRMAVARPRSHTYMIGRPGSGKSTLLLNLILQDIENGDAVVLIDPHGDLWNDVRERIPAHRRKDLHLAHMGDPQFQPKLNVLGLGPGDPAEARAQVVDTLCQLVRRLMFSGLTVDATGPMFNKYFRAALMLLMEAEGAQACIQNVEKVFSDESYRDELRYRDCVTAETKQQWEQILNVTGNDQSIENMTPWVTSKLTMLTQSAILRPILGAATTDLDFSTVLAEKKICLINLASGRIGGEATALLGGILTHRLEQAAKRQDSLPVDARFKASVYFDEFHTFVSEFLRPLMAESRKYGLRVTLANQTLSQMVKNTVDGGIFHEVLGNCANTIVFAVDVEDARYLAPRFGGKLDALACVSQPNFQAVCQFQTPTATMGPFVVRTMPPPPKTAG